MGRTDSTEVTLGWLEWPSEDRSGLQFFDQLDRSGAALDL